MDEHPIIESGTVGEPDVEPAQEDAVRQPAEVNFARIVALVLAGAALAIGTIIVVVVAVTSYAEGRERGHIALANGIDVVDARFWCTEVARDHTKPGSAMGAWDVPWIWGCQRVLGE